MSRLKKLGGIILGKLAPRFRRTSREDRESYFANKSPRATFSEIYEKNVWGGKKGEFYSGEGSDQQVAQIYLSAVNRFFRDHRPLRVIDLGCGDYRVASQFERTGYDYVGIDVVPGLIAKHNLESANESTFFMQCDIVSDDLPDGDVCLIRQVLQHLSNDEITKIITKCRSKYDYLIITEHYPPLGTEFVPNIDIPHGAHLRLSKNSAVCLDEPPFGLCSPKLLAEAIVDKDQTVIRTFLFERI